MKALEEAFSVIIKLQTMNYAKVCLKLYTLFTMYLFEGVEALHSLVRALAPCPG